MNGEKKWYVVNTYSGHENKVKANLTRRIETMDLGNILFQIVVAEKKEYKIKETKKGRVMKEEIINLYPGYLFVEMIMSDESWYVVRNTPGVTGFIGSSGGGTKPFPVPQEEMLGILELLEKNATLKPINQIDEGDRVKILNETLKNRLGIVKEISKDKETAKVILENFENAGTIDIPVNDLIRIDE